MSEIAVIGAGAWGTALSIVLGKKGTHQVRLWAYEQQVCQSIQTRRTNELFLPEQSVSDSVRVINSFEEALRRALIVVSVMPLHHCRMLLLQFLLFITVEIHFF